MATRKQINANRRNAKKGGPKTDAGRAAVRNNAARHGLASIHPVLIGEDYEPFRNFLKALTDELQPVGIMEIMLVEQIADASWRRRRVTMLEQGLFDILRGEVEPEIKKKYDVINQQATLHLITCKDSSGQLEKYYRYDARFERSFFKALKELQSLQAARAEAEAEEAVIIETEAVENAPPEPAKKEIAEQSQLETKSSPKTLDKEPNAPPNEPIHEPGA
jgi:hypothetical protein